MIYESILDTVGHTPSVRVRALAAGYAPRVYVKLETFNPTFSVKDRPAVRIIREAERSGDLQPGGTIVESTSGNFGKSLAMIGAACGYKVILVVDHKVSKATLDFCRALGATIVLVDTPDDAGNFQAARIARVQALLQEIPQSFWPNQYSNAYNPTAHEETTAREILADFGAPDILVASVSTGGHLSGTAKGVKSQSPATRVIAVDAEGSAAFGFPFKPYLLGGIGLGWKPDNLHDEYVDRVQIVADRDAFSCSQLLARHEGILVGGSGGAVAFACLCAAHAHPDTRTIVGIAPDTGANYLDQYFSSTWLSDRHISLYATLEELHAAIEVAATVVVPTR